MVVHYGSSGGGGGEVVNEIRATGGKAIGLQADLRQRADIRQLFAQIDQELGRIDIVVNSAGEQRNL